MSFSSMARLSALDPGKQGLKLSLGDYTGMDPWLSALDPGKQGLKQENFVTPGGEAWNFQRLIQENKD